jgi:hypothetical protein
VRGKAARNEGGAETDRVGRTLETSYSRNIEAAYAGGADIGEAGEAEGGAALPAGGAAQEERPDAARAGPSSAGLAPERADRTAQTYLGALVDRVDELVLLVVGADGPAQAHEAA